MKHTAASPSLRWITWAIFLLAAWVKPGFASSTDGPLPVFGTLGGVLELEPTDRARYQSAKVKLVAFGYTSCQHVCPMILAKYAQVQRQLKAEPGFVSVFVSFDSGRDDSLSLQTYLEKFHGQILGMSGDEQTIKAAMRQFGATYRSIEMTDDYDHTQRIYLLDDQNQVRALFEPNEPMQTIVGSIHRLL